MYAEQLAGISNCLLQFLRGAVTPRTRFAWIVTRQVDSMDHGASTLEEHTHHKAGSAGSECVACHMPEIQMTIADVKVHAHTFQFISPAMTDKYKIQNPCTSCHADKSTQWALAQMKDWKGTSPWRVLQ